MKRYRYMAPSRVKLLGIISMANYGRFHKKGAPPKPFIPELEDLIITLDVTKSGYHKAIKSMSAEGLIRELPKLWEGNRARKVLEITEKGLDVLHYAYNG